MCRCSDIRLCKENEPTQIFLSFSLSPARLHLMEAPQQNANRAPQPLGGLEERQTVVGWINFLFVFES